MSLPLACLLAALTLALGLALYRKLAALPRIVLHIIRQERASETTRAHASLQEAVALQAGQSLRALREHEEQLAAGLRAQITEANARARRLERRAADAGVALDAATVLVRELRALLLETRTSTQPAPLALHPSPPPPPDLDERPSSAEEVTRVADRPALELLKGHTS